MPYQGFGVPRRARRHARPTCRGRAPARNISTWSKHVCSHGGRCTDWRQAFPGRTFQGVCRKHKAETRSPSRVFPALSPSIRQAHAPGSKLCASVLTIPMGFCDKSVRIWTEYMRRMRRSTDVRMISMRHACGHCHRWGFKFGRACEALHESLLSDEIPAQAWEGYRPHQEYILKGLLQIHQSLHR